MGDELCCSRDEAPRPNFVTMDLGVAYAWPKSLTHKFWGQSAPEFLILSLPLKGERPARVSTHRLLLQCFRGGGAFQQTNQHATTGGGGGCAAATPPKTARGGTRSSSSAIQSATVSKVSLNPLREHGVHGCTCGQACSAGVVLQ
jgi:hypothetical protein